MNKRSSGQIVISVLFALVLREIKNRFGRVRMGAFWTLAEPLAHILLLAFVIAYVRGRTLPGMEYPVFLLVGLVPFFLFRNIALRLMGSVDANQSLFAYKQIKPLDTFAARFLVEFMLSSVVYCILLFALGWWGFNVSIYKPLEWFASIMLGLVFSFSLGVLFAIIVDAVHELRLVIRLAFMPLYFLSGVIFPPSYLPHNWLQYILWNPYLHLIELIRSNAIEFYVPVDGVSASYVGGVTLIVLCLSLWLYRVRRFSLISI